MRIFFGGPLTNLKDPARTKAFYLRLGEAAKRRGFEFFWAYQSGTDPIKNPDVDPHEVYDVDTEELDKSDVMVAYVGEASTGTGIEIEHALAHNIPVVILYEKGKKVSRMLRGSPAIKQEIVYTDESDALKQFEAFLDTLED